MCIQGLEDRLCLIRNLAEQFWFGTRGATYKPRSAQKRWQNFGARVGKPVRVELRYRESLHLSTRESADRGWAFIGPAFFERAFIEPAFIDPERHGDRTWGRLSG